MWWGGMGLGRVCGWGGIACDRMATCLIVQDAAVVEQGVDEPDGDGADHGHVRDPLPDDLWAVVRQPRVLLEPAKETTMR